MRFLGSAVVGLFCATLLLIWGEAGAQITLDEILQRNVEERESIRSGRIRYTVERYESPAYSELRKEVKRRSLEEKVAAFREPGRGGAARGALSQWKDELENFEVRSKIEALQTAGPYEVDFVFDRDREAFKSRMTDTRDVEALIDQFGLGELGKGSLNKRFERAIVRGTEVGYGSGSNHVTVRYDEQSRLYAARTLELGFLPAEVAQDVEHTFTEDNVNGGMLSLRLVEGGRRHEYVLDRSLGFRVRRCWILEGDRLVFESSVDHKRWGEYVFPSVYVSKSYDVDGELWESEKFTFRSVELNVSIEESEFEVEIPPDASFYDARTGERREEAGVEAERVAREIVRDVLKETAEEAPEEMVEVAEAAEEEIEIEVLQVPEEEVSEAPEEPRPSRAWVYVTLAVVALVVAAALLDWRRKRGARG